MLFPATPALNPSKPFAQIFLATLAESLSGCTRSEILTYTALSAHADPAGHCWPGRARLSELTGLDVHHVSRATSALAAKGIIRKRVVAGRRVHYTLLDRALRSRNQPVPICAPITDQQDLNPKEPCQPAPPLPPTAALSFEEPTQPQNPELDFVALAPADVAVIKTPPPDCIPELWIGLARELRPDLSLDHIQKSADTFLDHYRAKGTVLRQWIYAWKNWIKRERVPKPRPIKPVPPQPTPLSAEERAERDAIVAERMRMAEEAAERRRLAMLTAAGIDPATGLPITAGSEAPAVEAAPVAVAPAEAELVEPASELPAIEAVEAPVVAPVAVPVEAPSAVPVAQEPPPPRSTPPPMSERERQEQIEINRQRMLQEWARRMSERGIPFPGDDP